jgi:hypothetical protein
MHNHLDQLHKFGTWLLANNSSVLTLITACYAVLTLRMANAIARQTRAMIQPVALLDFHWENNEKYYPVGYFEVKNLGTQPLLLLDMKLFCHLNEGGHSRHFTDHFILWDEHIIPPGQSLRPKFDFKCQFEREKLPWSWMGLSYSLEVVTSDLSKQVSLKYRNIPVLGIANVEKGMPLSVRWRYFLKPFGYRYHWLLYRFKRPRIGQ